MTAPSNPLLRSQIKFTASSYKKKTKEYWAIQDYRNLIETMEIRS